jgi:hypothetical protein
MAAKAKRRDVTDPAAAAQPPAHFRCNPPGRGQLAVFPSTERRTRSSRPALVSRSRYVRRRGGVQNWCGMIVATATPARTTLKNSRLARQPPGERHAYFGTGHRILEKQNSLQMSQLFSESAHPSFARFAFQGFYMRDHGTRQR